MMPVLTGIYGKAALYDFRVLSINPASSGPEILFLLLKALISLSSPFSPTRLTS
jgi:hypothetical protein